jgi:hypothetical protein
MDDWKIELIPLLIFSDGLVSQQLHGGDFIHAHHHIKGTMDHSNFTNILMSDLQQKESFHCFIALRCG